MRITKLSSEDDNDNKIENACQESVESVKKYARVTQSTFQRSDFHWGEKRRLTQRWVSFCQAAVLLLTAVGRGGVESCSWTAVSASLPLSLLGIEGPPVPGLH